MINYGLTYYESMKPVGECLLIEKLTEDNLRKSHGLYIPEVAKQLNNKIGVGKVIALSKKAKEETNINENDYVLYDYFSANDDNGKHILTKYENIIMQLSEDEAYKFLNGEL